MTGAGADDDWLSHYTRGPLVPMALNVGVTGHRPRKLATCQGSRDTVNDPLISVLRAVQAATGAIHGGAHAGLIYDTAGPAVLRIISPLAEGVDRWCAEEAVALGYELVAPLPFAQAEYECDFDAAASESSPDGTIDAFRRQLAAAQPNTVSSRVVELDGDPENRAAAYEACGRFVASHADVMIAVWDGAAATSEAGTGATVAEAYNQQIPVIWIEASPPHKLHLIRPRDFDERVLLPARALEELHAVQQDEPEYDTPDASFRDALDGLLKETLVPARILEKGRERLAAYTHERGVVDDPATAPDFQALYQGPLSLRRGWPGPLAGIFTSMRRCLAPNWWVTRFRHRHGGETTHAPAPLPIDERNPAINRIFAAFLRADQLGSHYANCHRSLFVAIYVMGALALTCAVGAIYFKTKTWGGVNAMYLLTGTELVLLGLVVSLVGVDRWRRLHERWIDYRLVAELLRHMLYLALVGDPGSRRRIRAQALETVDLKSSEGEGPSPRAWAFLYFESVMRHAGVVGARYTPEYLGRARDYATHTHIGGQIDYHGLTGARCELMARHLGWMSLGLFTLTVAAAVVKLCCESLADQYAAGFLAGAFPALAAASYGIRSHAEFEIVNKRSHSMIVRLMRQHRTLERLRHLSADNLRRMLRGSADTMLAEATEWADIFEEKETEAG